MKTVFSRKYLSRLWIGLLFATLGTGAAMFSARSAAQDQKASATRTSMDQPAEAAKNQKLTPEQYYIVKECGTEPAFHNAYWDNHEAGIYVDVVSGEPLFSSLDKFDSGTGWPSFTRPIENDKVTERADRLLGTLRTEIRGKKSDAHLGHVFNDGPGPGGLRYCMNSAALRFIPVAKLQDEGYGRFVPLFAGTNQPVLSR